MFEIGDKVEHETYGDGVVQLRDLYRVHFDGEVKHLRAEDLKPIAKYSIGDAVMAYNCAYTILSGLFVDADGTRSYVARDGDTGDCQLIVEDDFHK
jgi:hypothetical protein